MAARCRFVLLLLGLSLLGCVRSESPKPPSVELVPSVLDCYRVAFNVLPVNCLIGSGQPKLAPDVSFSPCTIMLFPRILYSLILSVPVFAFSSALSFAVFAAEDGFQLYVEACKNSLAISSAQAEFICVKTYADEQGATPQKLESHFSARGLFKGRHPFLTVGRKDNLYLWETRRLKDFGMSEPPASVIYVGNPYFFLDKDGKQQSKSLSGTGEDVAAYLCLSRVGNMRFSVNSLSLWSPQFQLSGRIQGTLAQKSLWLLTAAGSQMTKTKLTFSPKGLTALKQDDLENKISYIVGGVATYDKTNGATIVDVLRDGKISVRYWIDPSKGYICPLIQRFNSGEITEEYLSNEYISDKSSGLWYPSKYTAKQHYGKVEAFYELTLVLGSLSLNKPMADGLFALDVPSGESVFDDRIGGETVFVANDNGALSFTNGDINLRSFPWLEERGTIYSGDRTVGTPQKFSWARIIFISSGILLIFVAFSIMLYRKWKELVTE